MLTSISTDLILVILAGFVGGLVARVFKQPLAIGYICAGILIGPHTSAIKLSNVNNITHIADIGAALLLFSLGLEFSLKDLKPIWKIAVLGTLLQVVVTFAGGSLLMYELGWATIPALWMGAAFISSSSALILRTLVARNLKKTLSGRIMLGVSIVQDLMIIPIFIFLLRISMHGFSAEALFLPFFSFALLLLVMGVFATRVIPFALHKIARLDSQELFMLSTISLGFGIGYISHQFGLSVAFGAFLAGLVLSESEFGHKALSEMVPLRNIFGMVFFASIGMLFNPGFVLNNIGNIVAMLGAVTIGKGIILAIIAITFGYQRIIPFALLLGMVPISEIAFVLARDANAINAIDNHVYSLILNVVVISMIIGPLAASLSGPAYQLFRKFRPDQPIKGKNLSEQGLNGHLVLVGTENYTSYLVRAFKRRKSPFIIIEPLYQSFFELSKKGFPLIYGEADKTDILQAAHVDKAKMLIIFESETCSSATVIEKAQNLNPQLPIILLTKLASVKENWRKNKQVRVIILEKQIAERIARLVVKELKTT